MTISHVSNHAPRQTFCSRVSNALNPWTVFKMTTAYFALSASGAFAATTKGVVQDQDICPLTKVYSTENEIQTFKYIERPFDEFWNTGNHHYLVEAQEESVDRFGRGLKILNPPDFAKKWPTVSEHFFLECSQHPKCSGPARQLDYFDYVGTIHSLLPKLQLPEGLEEDGKGGVKEKGVPSDVWARYEKTSKEWKDVNQKRSALLEQEFSHIGGHLTLNDLPEELSDPIERKFTVLCYNKLVDDHAFSILQKAMETSENPYEYTEINKITLSSELSMLQPIADQYMSEVHPTYEHFRKVLDYVNALSNHNVNDLALHILNRKKKNLTFYLDLYWKEIEEHRSVYNSALKNSKKSVSDFPKGNFDFINDKMSRRMLKNAFQATAEANMWHVFDKDVTKLSHVDLLKYCVQQPGFRERVMDVIGDRDLHFGASMSWVLTNLAIMHRKGWEQYVKESLAESLRIVSQKHA